jgi:hypothetical protein
MSQIDIIPQLSSEARAVQAKLRELWADEGVEQLAIFLDPDIVTVLEEIKRLSMHFVDQVARLSDDA